MKNLFLIFALALSIGCQGQTSAATLFTATDTVVNAGTETATTSKISSPAANIAVQAVVTKLSGTVAGTVLLQGTLDGTNYVDISTDTLTMANVTTNTFIWNVTPSKYLQYRLSATGVGTMSAILKGYYLTRQ